MSRNDETIQKITENAKKNQYERSRDKVIHALAGIAGEQKTNEEFEKFKEKISDALEILVKYVGTDSDQYKKRLGTVQKSDRPISKPFMEFLNQECDIPFVVKSSRPGYTVEFDKNKNLQDYGLIDNSAESIKK